MLHVVKQWQQRWMVNNFQMRKLKKFDRKKESTKCEKLQWVSISASSSIKPPLQGTCCIQTIRGTSLVVRRFMYLFIVVLQVCIFFPKIHFGSRGYSLGLLSFQIFSCFMTAFMRLAHAFRNYIACHCVSFSHVGYRPFSGEMDLSALPDLSQSQLLHILSQIAAELIRRSQVSSEGSPIPPPTTPPVAPPTDRLRTVPRGWVQVSVL